MYICISNYHIVVAYSIVITYLQRCRVVTAERPEHWATSVHPFVSDE